jgi:hypothetical protein
MTAKTAEDRLRYAKQYASVFWLGPNHLLQLPPNKRIHIMKSLSCLARFTGKTEQWRQVRQQYQLSWSTGTEKIDAFERFFDSSKTLDSLLRWAREAISVLPADMAEFVKFNILTGLRSSECFECIKLIKNPETFSTYYNEEQQTLQHFRIPTPLYQKD